MVICDNDNYRMRKVNLSGIISTLAGNGVQGSTGDGGLATSAELNTPEGYTIDKKGNVYIAEATGYRIRKINSSGIISTFAGNGIAGFMGDGGLAINASLSNSFGLAIDSIGNIYIADTGNNRVRKVDTTGIITTFAGTGTNGYSGDGGLAINASLGGPYYIEFDLAGNLYTVETNHTIRKINKVGIISTVAGIDSAGYSGDGGLATNAKLNLPLGIAFDASGNLFIADAYNHVVRKVNLSGIISTVVGNGTGNGTPNGSFSGDGGPALSAGLNNPAGLSFDYAGDLYIADGNNNRIRKVTLATGVEKFPNSSKQIIIYPNPTTGQFTIEPNSTNKLTIDLFDVNGRHIFNKVVVGTADIDANSLDNGVYTLAIKNNTDITYKKLVITR